MERYHPLTAIQECIEQSVALILEARSTVCFTGSGISAAAGLYTYRGVGGIDQLEEHTGEEEEQEEEEDDPGE